MATCRQTGLKSRSTDLQPRQTWRRGRPGSSPPCPLAPPQPQGTLRQPSVLCRMGSGPGVSSPSMAVALNPPLHIPSSTQKWSPFRVLGGEGWIAQPCSWSGSYIHSQHGSPESRPLCLPPWLTGVPRPPQLSLTTHSLAMTLQPTLTQFPSCCLSNSMAKNPGTSLNTQEAGPVPPPPDKQPGWSGRGRAGSFQDLKWLLGQVRTGVSLGEREGRLKGATGEGWT
jgi:hypothetical protein